jgi:tripartite-type tricarboxylate transporter receptor subunit TctC
MIKRRRIVSLLSAAMTFAIATPQAAQAQGFPDKRISMVVGFGAGGMTDVSSRMLGRHMEKTLGVNVIITEPAPAAPWPLGAWPRCQPTATPWCPS